ncbi:PREDICTED: trypsin-1-like [Dufourea novaeangliae]|uniref:trypsin-1-like n=1 Tax=Dufourea novaeangliae TaxID=178035 RepID=UPI000767B117|nr:PREDICTED: trypsin-1-like [Dufourea novaeangliae]
MFLQASILSLLAFAAANPLARQPFLSPLIPSGQIVGGKDVNIEEVPHQVSLQSSGMSFCGGSIIADQWVVTAAHCMAYPADWMTVRAGTTTKSSGGSVHKVAEIIIHEDYVTNYYGVPENDVAVMKLSTPFKLDKTRQPIRIFKQNEESKVGINAVVSGWGAVREGGSTAEVLQAVNVPIVSKSVCNKAYQPYGGVPAGQICAAVQEGGKDACQGDSGGPMTIGGRLAGLVSWGYGCARQGYPGVHTEVAAFSDWIVSKTGIKV